MSGSLACGLLYGVGVGLGLGAVYLFVTVFEGVL